ncbi:MAG: sugar ABC transporter permease [Sphaerochaetaceae bacterium]|nr:sugar ABC transporter permease [Sphaerochaetaceae bacterium]
MKKLTWKTTLFMLPLILFLIVFSFYPIVSSFVYSFFNYRTNDQSIANLYTKAHFNAKLFYEDCDYLLYYLPDDILLVDEKGKIEFEKVTNLIEEKMEPYKTSEGVITITSKEAEELIAFVEVTQTSLSNIYGSYPNVSFYNNENNKILLDEMAECFITPNHVGFKNFANLMKDPRFWLSLWNTFLFTLISVSAEFVLGMGLALIMNKAIRGIGIVRTSALIPWAIPTAVSALIWGYLYDGSSGIIAELFANLGLIASPQSMLLSARGAMSAAILADIWKTTPYMALLLLAGLQVIDHGLYESAAIDGCNKVKTYFKITLPLLKPSILVALLFRTLDAFRVYDLIAILTGGGPGGATETLSIYSYKVLVGQSNYGYGSAIIIAMFICVAILATLFVKVLGADLIGEN